MIMSMVRGCDVVRPFQTWLVSGAPLLVRTQGKTILEELSDLSGYRIVTSAFSSVASVEHRQQAELFREFCLYSGGSGEWRKLGEE